MDLSMLQNLNDLLPYKRETFNKFIAYHCRGLANMEEKVNMILDEIELTIFDGMTLNQLMESVILVATQNIQNDTDYDKIATRLQLTTFYKTALDLQGSYKNFSELYKESFKKYIKKGIEIKLIDPKLGEIFKLDELVNILNSDNDDIFKYIGISTIEHRYALRDREQNIMETPQFMWMRIAMGISLNEKNPTEQAKVFYKKLSTVEYIPGGSTNIGAGTTFPELSNCYLMDTDDDTNAIFDNVKNVALISKATGGIGISITKLRAAGSPVKSNNTLSTGPIPFVKVMDAALKSMSRAGKKYGAMCIYMENWHINFPDFIDLKQNAGDDYRRIRTGDTAVYISDEFMKRVVNNEKWYMFDPAETPELPELYGAEFSKKYKEYCEKADRGEMNMYKTVPAREQMKLILTSLQSTSHPWLTWKDTINLRALNNNTGTIHCSNLCTEICLPQDRNNIAVCNLAYINLAHHVSPKEEGLKKLDWKRLEETVRVAMRHLDNLIDVNRSPLKETKNSDENNRAVGLGMSGFAEVLEHFGFAYDSAEAYDLMDRIAEFISYISIDESCNMAEERGSYNNYAGSMWSKGHVPFDTIENVAKSRVASFTDLTNSEDTNQTNKVVGNSLSIIKQKIESGISNASSNETKELYEIFNQLANLIDSSTNPVEKIGDSNETSNNFNQHGEGINLTQSRETRQNWEKLRMRVKKGIRNATTMAIAPNASTGLVAGTSPGLDPRFAQIFSRNTYSGKFLDINHNLVKDLKSLGIWDQVKDQVLSNYGDISEIEEIPDNLKEIYKTSFQISPYAYIEVASRAQKWIDQAISRNMYLETRDIDEMIEIYTEAWRRGLKTTYYLHVKPRHSSEQSNVKVNKGKDLNKSGFASVQTAAQPTLDLSKEIKGFGYATQVKEEEKEEEVMVVGAQGGNDQTLGFGKLISTSTKSAGVGFGFNQKSKTNAEQKVNFKSEKFTPIGKACPIDPAERAACEGCQ
jgi:ribonucleoside-diphosphate reductase alpha chain